MQNRCIVAFLALSILTIGAHAQTNGEQLDQEVIRHDKQIKDLRRDFTAAENRRAAASQNYDATFTSLSTQLATLTEDAKSQTGAIQNYAATLAGLQTQMAAQKAALDAQAVDMNNLRTQLNARASTDSLNNAINVLYKDTDVLNADTKAINDLQARLGTDESTLNDKGEITHSAYYSADSKGHSAYLGLASNSGVGLLQLQVGKQTVVEAASDNNGGYLLVSSLDGKLAGRFKPGMDLAERFESAGSALRPGTVATINPRGTLSPSRRSYDQTVVGVVSGAGSLSPAISLGPQEDTRVRSPVAVAGQVYVRVCVESGPIRPGDLLVASSTPGVAMRASANRRIVGSIIGKALEKFDTKSKGADKEGLVRMLVMLR
jgi:hypothetical protein